MKKIIPTTPGDIIEIPLPDGSKTYARILLDKTYAFYDAKTKEDIKDLQNIITKPILFTAWVDVFGLKEGYWKIIGNVLLEGKLENYYPIYFTPGPVDPNNVKFYNSHKDEIEEAIKNDWIGFEKIQIGGLHGRNHIESRIMDYYEGKRNVYNKNDIVMFKRYLGFPLDNV